MRKRLFFLIPVLFFGFQLMGQTDTTEDKSPVKKIKKFIIRKSETEKDSVQITKVEVNVSDSLNNKKSGIVYKVLPTLSLDKKGFTELDIMPFIDNSKIPDEHKYIIFEFVINEKGNVSEFISHESNEEKLTFTLLDKLKNTYWNAAEDTNNQRVEYNFGKWIVKVPLNAALRDYEVERD